MRPRDLIRTGLLGVALGASGLAAADETGSGFGRMLELPAHRALMATRGQDSSVLAPFETDGCSGGLSDVWRLAASQFPEFSEIHEQAPPWEVCCVIHDRAYHNGGDAQTPEASFSARLTADRALESCVVTVGKTRNAEFAARYDATPEQVNGAYATIGGAMYLAVRFGGAPCSGLPWRWGFGYPGCSVLQGQPD